MIAELHLLIMQRVHSGLDPQIEHIPMPARSTPAAFLHVVADYTPMSKYCRTSVIRTMIIQNSRSSEEALTSKFA